MPTDALSRGNRVATPAASADPLSSILAALSSSRDPLVAAWAQRLNDEGALQMRSGDELQKT